MSGATPVEMLEAEHRVIQKVVAGMSVLAERLDGIPLAGRLLTLEDQQVLAREFEELEHELGHEVHERFAKLAAKLELEVSGVNPR